MLSLFAGASAFTVLSRLSAGVTKLDVTEEPCVRIIPIAGRSYSPGFLKFAATARFSSPREAVESVKNKRISYDLVWK